MAPCALAHSLTARGGIPVPLTEQHSFAPHPHRLFQRVEPGPDVGHLGFGIVLEQFHEFVQLVQSLLVLDDHPRQLVLPPYVDVQIDVGIEMQVVHI